MHEPPVVFFELASESTLAWQLLGDLWIFLISFYVAHRHGLSFLKNNQISEHTWIRKIWKDYPNGSSETSYFSREKICSSTFRSAVASPACCCEHSLWISHQEVTRAKKHSHGHCDSSLITKHPCLLMATGYGPRTTLCRSLTSCNGIHGVGERQGSGHESKLY